MGFRFEQLEVWKTANNYASDIYKVTKKFPREELFSLSDQLKRSATSIAANIAEGSGSDSKKDFRNYLSIAVKSVYETVSHLNLAKDQKYISEKEMSVLYSQAEVLVKKIQAFRKWLNK